jgi:hypothetical protein
MHERVRLFTTVESADKKARIYWALEIGDITLGSGGGGSGAEYGGSTTRVGPSSGGGLGADGVNVETKNAYLWFEIPGGFGMSALVGIHNMTFMNSPTGAFLDDDGAGIQLTYRSDFADAQYWMVKTDENNRFDADDNDMHALRFGINITKDLRLTVEGLLLNQQCFARRSAVLGGSCVSADFGESFWVGGTVGAKLGTLNLDGSIVYGQRQLYSAALDTNVEESGFGLQFTARLPIGPLASWWHAWYTTGDENRPVGASGGIFPENDATLGAGRAFSTSSNTTRQNQDSDKLPVPIAGASWLTPPFVGEALNSGRTTGGIAFGQPLYNDWTGTWGLGGSVTYAILSNLSVGGGVAYIHLSEDNSGGIFGEWAVEVDGGLIYTLNPQTSFQVVGSWITPDQTDDAWALVWRALYAF